MQLWVVLLASLLTLALLALCSALKIELEARGQGERSGAWVIAGAVGVGPLALAGVGRAGAPLHFELRLFGRRVPLPRRRPPRAARGEEPPARKPAGAKAAQGLRLGPLELLELLLAERRRLRIERLRVEASYGFQDIVLTGKLAGALYALSGALPAGVQLEQRPRFDGAESWELSVDGALRLSLGLVLLELVWYMFDKWRARTVPRGRTPSAPAENPS